LKSTYHFDLTRNNKMMDSIRLAQSAQSFLEEISGSHSLGDETSPKIKSCVTFW